MKAKRKLMLGVASLGILVILAGVALGIALAALTGNVNSGFTITYSAQNVNAIIAGTYSVAPINLPGDIVSFFEGPDTIIPDMMSGIVFDKNSSSDKSFKPISLEIPAPLFDLDNFVVFNYRVTNLDEEDLSLKLSIEGEIDSNIEISYFVTNNYEEDVQAKGIAFEDRKEIKEKFSALEELGLDHINMYYLEHYLSSPLETNHRDIINRSEEAKKLVREIVTEYNSLFTFSNTFPLNTTVPPSGATWEDDMLNIISGTVEGDYKSTTIYIKIALKDVTVNVKDFSANLKFDLVPAV